MFLSFFFVIDDFYFLVLTREYSFVCSSLFFQYLINSFSSVFCFDFIRNSTEYSPIELHRFYRQTNAVKPVVILRVKNNEMFCWYSLGKILDGCMSRWMMEDRTNLRMNWKVRWLWWELVSNTSAHWSSKWLTFLGYIIVIIYRFKQTSYWNSRLMSWTEYLIDIWSCRRDDILIQEPTQLIMNDDQ